MKSPNRSSRQSGFFDFGMSLLILAVAGGVVYGVESSRSEQIAAQQHRLAAEQAEPTAMAEFSARENTDAVSALR